MILNIDTILLQLLGGIEKGRRDDDKVHVAGSYRLAPIPKFGGVAHLQLPRRNTLRYLI